MHIIGALPQALEAEELQEFANFLKKFTDADDAGRLRAICLESASDLALAQTEKNFREKINSSRDIQSLRLLIREKIVGVFGHLIESRGGSYEVHAVEQDITQPGPLSSDRFNILYPLQKGIDIYQFLDKN